jgi:hypothetical protein
MPFEKKVVAETASIVKMKYVGHFNGVEKIVQLPIPLIAKSQKLEAVLSFKRTSESRGPGFCDVPIEWVGALMDVGGNWKLVEEPSTELLSTIRDAQEACKARMDKFALENELVEA